jgi:virginiamycin B lyase
MERRPNRAFRSEHWTLAILAHTGRLAAPYAIYVDQRDIVWLSDFGANAILSFEPTINRFTIIPNLRRRANVRQIAGRPGEVWLPESGTDYLVRISTGTGE